MDVGTLLRRARGSAAECSGANKRARSRLDGTRAALLYYHRVVPQAVAEADAIEPGMYVTPEAFARQLDWLRELFRVLPLGEITDRLERGKPLPPGACAITFDDGWRDNYEHALAPLAARDLPATIFVVTDRVGTPGAFWPDEVCRRLECLDAAEQHEVVAAIGATGGGHPRDALLDYLKRLDADAREAVLGRLRARTPAPAARDRELMDWDEIGEVAAKGIDIESHGATHAILTAIGPDAVASELRASRAELCERGYGRHDLFAYPSGSYDQGVMQAARAAGYRSAVTTDHGLASSEQDLFALPRLCIHQGISGSRGEFLLKVPGAS